ncbi:MAG TPA: BCAM0308 family protein [Acidobacteriota bacterium]
MNAAKRYTNTTFTKRVDHGEGLRPVRHPSEPLICRICQAVYSAQRWTPARHAPHLDRELKATVCPACHQMKSGTPSGLLYVQGMFLIDHGAEVETLLRNEAERASEDNPLARVMSWKLSGPLGWTVATTTEHLAQRLGGALQKSFGGDVVYLFSHENKFAHVWWTRN